MKTGGDRGYGRILPPSHYFSMADTIRLRRREYIADINSSSGSPQAASAFAFSSNINVGLSAVFPWLAPIAANYNEYMLYGLRFIFVPQVGPYQSSNSGSATVNPLGSLTMSFEPDVASGGFNSEFQQLNAHGTVSRAISGATMVFEVQLNTVQRKFFVRSGAVPGGYDPRFYDVGIFQISVNNMLASNMDLGKLYVEYDVVLEKPVSTAVVNAPMCASLKTTVASGSDGAAVLWPQSNTISSTTNTLDMGLPGDVAQSTSTSSITLAANQFAFPVGVYQGTFVVSGFCYGTTAGVGVPSFTLSVDFNCSQVASSMLAATTAPDIAGAKQLAFQFAIKVTAPGNTQGIFKITPANKCTGGTTVYMVVTPYSQLVSTI